MFLALLQLHAAHPDDLTHQEEPRPHQVTAAQVLQAKQRRLTDAAFGYVCSAVNPYKYSSIVVFATDLFNPQRRESSRCVGIHSP